MADSKNEPSVISYRQDDLEKSIKRIEDKLDRVIENYATKVELAQAINDRDNKINELSNNLTEKINHLETSIADIAKRRTLSATIAIVVSIITTITAAIALYEIFR